MAPQFKALTYKASQVADARLDEAEGIGLILGEYREPWGIKLSWLPVAKALQDSGATPVPLASFPDRPGWDAIPAGHKNWRVLSFQAGSAIAPLVVQTTGQPGMARVEPGNSRGVFQYPRFLRHAGAHPAITAVDVSGGYRITLYQPQAEGLYGPRQTLEAPTTSDALQDARLLALDEGYLLFAQRFLPGEHRQFSAGGESIILRTGVVEAQRLDRDLKPTGPVWQPFGSQAVFQFDADALNGRVAVFATTPVGWRLAVIPAKDIGHAQPLRFEGNTQEPLSSPSVLVVNAGLALSLLANAGSDQAGLWLGKWQPSP